jgi:hypothetical protein
VILTLWEVFIHPFLSPDATQIRLVIALLFVLTTVIQAGFGGKVGRKKLSG